MKLSRRDLISTALAASALPLEAQEAAPDYLALAANQYKQNSEALDKVELPQATEPAFAFKV